MIRLLTALVTASLAAQTSIVGDVRSAARGGDLAAGERMLAAYETSKGPTAEYAAALSWLGRGALGAKDYVEAERYAAKARELTLKMLASRRLDDDRYLPIALGASIEVQAQALAAQGARSEAISFLDEELKRWHDTSIRTRIQKNRNLLSLEGKRAPPLDLATYVGPKPVALDRLEGKVLLLFFWAHWCPDCKYEAPILTRIENEFGLKGLVVVGPTKLYGFTARGEEATPDQELAYIDVVRKQYYGGIQGMTVPVSGETFAAYGSSTTPTIVLVDREGVVRLYHPGQMSYEELAEKVAALL